MPIITSTFKPAWWLKNPHLQTMWGTSFKKETKLDLISQKIALEDEDFIDVVKTPDINDKPIVVILHGLEGCIGSHYVKPLIKTLADNGYGVFFMHFRGCGYEPNKNTKGYSANDSEDLQTVVNKIKHEYKRDPFAVIGFSLGGSVVLKWLGEKGENANTTLGIGVSVPFKLKDAAMKLENGFSRIYQKRLLGICKNKFEKNISKEISSLNVSIESINNFYQFDNQITSQIKRRRAFRQCLFRAD